MAPPSERRPAPRRPAATVAESPSPPISAVDLVGAPAQSPRQLSDRIAMGRALWRDLVVGFAGQLAGLRLGFTQLAALYAVDDRVTLSIGDLAERLGRSASATSRLVEGLVRRGWLERGVEAADRRQRTLALTEAGALLLGTVDRARAEEFLAVVRPLPEPERALVAMGVAALADHAISRRGRLIKATPGA